MLLASWQYLPLLIFHKTISPQRRQKTAKKDKVNSNETNCQYESSRLWRFLATLMKIIATTPLVLVRLHYLNKYCTFHIGRTSLRYRDYRSIEWDVFLTSRQCVQTNWVIRTSTIILTGQMLWFYIYWTACIIMIIGVLIGTPFWMESCDAKRSDSIWAKLYCKNDAAEQSRIAWRSQQATKSRLERLSRLQQVFVDLRL